MPKPKLILIGGIVLAIILFVFFYLPGYTQYQELHKRESLLKKEIALLESENAAISAEIDRLRNDVTSLEKVLRDDMGLVKPGEELYKFVEEEKK